MAMAKSGAFWEHAPERSMANNSAVYTKKPTMRQFMHEWTTMMDNGTGERGVFNRGDVNATMPERRAHRDDWGLNPCGEIILRPFEFCNLSIAVARPEDTLSSLKRKVELATLWGTMQSTLTSFQYLRPEWAQNCNNERLLGVDITGQMDCYLLNHAPLRETTYAQCKAAAIAANRVYASWLGIPVSAAVTCVKPSGNSSQLLNVSSGIHPRYAEYYIRRVRIGATSPVASFLRAAGVPHAPEVGQHPLTPSVWVFEFPVMAPREAITRKATTALEQLAQWLDCKLAYTEHNPSCTVYVKEDEWLEVANWLWQHWEAVGGLSFLPYDNGVYMLAPYQEITHDDYVARMAAWPKLDWTQLALFETTDTTDVSREYACTSGACDL
jgi:ribonucleoside-diphosphate reductase alpha chain